MLRIILTILCFGQLVAATVQIRPHAQWTFDTPMEEVLFRSHGLGFPIYMIRTADDLRLYDSLGVNYKTILRYPGDQFQINEQRSAFMLTQRHESVLATDQENIFSFQVYDRTGEQQYTSVVHLDLFTSELKAQLTNDLSVLLYVPDQTWLLELEGEDTLVYLPNWGQGEASQGATRISAIKLNQKNEYVTAKTTQNPFQEDSYFTEIDLWNHDTNLSDPMIIPGAVNGIVGLPGTGYYFVELEQGVENSLHLFHRTDSLATYPWKTWDIEAIGNTSAFIVSERDLNLVNLGDGAIAYSVHPIDLSTISDACYMDDWGLFLYLRYDTFYTDEGRQAFRDFQLEGIDRSGRIVHKSSFGSWSYILPKINSVSKDLFAIHIYNAVLLYRMELKQE